jgi:GTP-binding protein
MSLAKSSICKRGNSSIEANVYDTTRIFIQGGDGGNGCVSFCREKFISLGGPDGGNGGCGGNIWFEAKSSLNSLSYLRKKMNVKAQSGTRGQGSNKIGVDGKDLTILVPCGTIIKKHGAPRWKPPLAELLAPGACVLLALGGRGGRGNACFKTNENKAPRIFESGENVFGMWIDLELKVIADVGIVGVPSAGKSSLLATMTSSRTKIAHYPFTTLTPVLGVCKLEMEPITFADLPGLLEGANLGHGLGIDFLRHCERCKILLHIIDGSSMDPLRDFALINFELELFSPNLAAKPQVVVYNKMDLTDSSDYFELISEYLTKNGINPPIPVSALSGKGIIDLVRHVSKVLHRMSDSVSMSKIVNVKKKSVRYSIKINEYFIESQIKKNGKQGFIVTGVGIETFAQLTDLEHFDSVKRFQKILEISGIFSSLQSLGVSEGDTVSIGSKEMLWVDL